MIHHLMRHGKPSQSTKPYSQITSDSGKSSPARAKDGATDIFSLKSTANGNQSGLMQTFPSVVDEI